MPNPVSTDGAGAVVCPFVADYSLDNATLNVEANTLEVVTINNIDHDIPDTADLASAFDCSGWGINKSLGVNKQVIGNLVVSLSGDVLHGILADAIGNKDGEMDSYLRGEFENAFAAAFPEYVKTLEGADVAAQEDASANLTDAGAQAGTAGTADAGNTLLGASVVRQTSTVSNYEFELDVSGGGIASAMIDGLTGAGGTAYLNSIFMQLPYARLTASTATDSSGSPVSSRLPLESGDSITFVFDIKVAASENPDNNAALVDQADSTLAPTANAATNSTTQAGISMDLGTRRVSVTISQE
jgi:hypothetical protein